AGRADALPAGGDLRRRQPANLRPDRRRDGPAGMLRIQSAMRIHSKAPKRQDGVMLLEALIAILIFSIGILAVVGLQAVSIRNVTDAKHRTEAAYLARHQSRGFSMVELMVAMVISLIGVIIIFQVFETSEGVRRTATSGGDAQQNGAVALYFMERDLRNAGMGINDTIYAGCNMIGSDSARTTPNFPPLGNPMILAPAFITAGVDAQTPDQLAVFYG